MSDTPNLVRLIRMARHQHAVRVVGNYKTWINTILDQRWIGARANWQVQGSPVLAFVERSSWVAKCIDCSEQVIVDIDEPFYCPNCQNAKNGGYARPVVWPDDRAEIERVLLVRSNPDMRNFLIGETLSMLTQENLEHGEGIE